MITFRPSAPKIFFFFRKEQDELMVMVYYVLYSLSCPQHECDS